MADPWWIGVDSPHTTVEGQAPTRQAFAQQNSCTLPNVYGPFTQAQADAFSPPAYKAPRGSIRPATPATWWVVFNPQISVAPVVVQAPDKKAAVAQYFQQEAGGQVGSQYPTKVAGPFQTQADAQNASGSLDQGVSAGSSAAGAANTKAGNPLRAINEFLGRLGQANTWIRALYIALGAGLIIVGLAKAASGTPIGEAALKAGKAAAIL